MAVIYEQTSDGLIHAYSDQGLMLHGGFPEGDYTEAYDPPSANRTYIEVAGQFVPTTPTIQTSTQISKRKLMNNLKQFNLWEPVKTYMEQTGVWDDFLMSTTLEKNDPLITEAVSALVGMGVLTTEQADEIIAASIAD